MNNETVALLRKAMVDAGNEMAYVRAGTLIPSIDYDYIDVQQTSSTVETYIYKTGGSGGITVRTIIITYTDNTKENIDTVTYA